MKIGENPQDFDDPFLLSRCSLSAGTCGRYGVVHEMDQISKLNDEELWGDEKIVLESWLEDQGCRFIQNYALRWRDLTFDLDYLVLAPIPFVVQIIEPNSTSLNRWLPVRLLLAQTFGRYLPAIGIMPSEDGIGGPNYSLDLFEFSVSIDSLPILKDLVRWIQADPLTTRLLDRGLPPRGVSFSNEDALIETWGRLYSPKALLERRRIDELHVRRELPESLTRDYSNRRLPIAEFLKANLGGNYTVETIRFSGRTPGFIKRDVYVSPSGRRIALRGADEDLATHRTDLGRLYGEPWTARAEGIEFDRSILLVRTHFGNPESPENIALPIPGGIISFLESAGWTVLPNNSFYDWMVLLSILREDERFAR